MLRTITKVSRKFFGSRLDRDFLLYYESQKLASLGSL